MKPISVEQLALILRGQLIAGSGDTCVDAVSIDSRTIQPGEVFFAIAGERFDGHDYIAAAAEKGAGCIVAQRDAVLPDGCDAALIRTDDCVEALGRFASWYRQLLNAKVIAITGSVGKTTTRQILHQILNRSFRCHQAKGSFNNHIGLPLTILSAGIEDEVLLLELGSNNLGEIEQLTMIANPDIAVLTAVAPSHLAGFGSLENIIREKASIALGLCPGGRLYVNGDQDDLLEYVKTNFDVPIVTVGQNQRCDVHPGRLESAGSSGFLEIEGQIVNVPLAGEANLFNVLMAWAVGRDMGISLDVFTEAAGLLETGTMRMEVETTGAVTILNDCYNASPVSMANGLSCLSAMAAESGQRKVFIAGSMAELGRQSDDYHVQLGQQAAAEGVGVLLACGDFAESVLKGAAAGERVPQMCAFEKTGQLCDNLHKWIKPDDIILVKGSRAANLEKAVQQLRDLFGGN